MDKSYLQRRHAHDRLCGIVRELARHKGFARWRDFSVVYENEFCPVVIFHGFGRLASVTLSAFYTLTREELIDILSPYMTPTHSGMLKEKI